MKNTALRHRSMPALPLLLFLTLAVMVSWSCVSTAAASGQRTSDELDHVYRLEHDVQVGPGQTIHLYETFTLRDFVHPGPARAMLMIPGPITTGDFYNIPVDGYDGGAIMAEHGFFAFAADLEGTGRSSFPANGRDVTFKRDVADMTAVVRYIRRLRDVPKVDVLGESWGGGIAAAVASDRADVNSCVMASMLYKTPSPGFVSTFLTPAFQALLASFTDGYFPTSASFYDQFVALSPAAVANAMFTTQPGRYSITPEDALFELPFFDPSMAQAPGLVINGELDPNAPAADARALAHDYGRHGARLVLIPNATHVPRIESSPSNDIFWKSVIDFVTAHRDRA